ncbi:hypothetical protein KO495_16950 [Colwellia sp. D2M02]|uniref:hypothetical protein n=1 Tax=Colwellia sp. D2M02 TaxID=2841562 RepID=UPI001C0A2DFE|nr:hypothetical protein [Colwellia sp. D2M02]MBU2894992.1 hypothetical protein [Colwellia sp. D2M02]
MDKKRYWLAAVMAGVLLSSCSNEESAIMNNQNTAQLKAGQHQALISEDAKDEWQQVTVIFNDFEGGFYGLVTLNGDNLLPLNLPKEYQVKGTKLKVKGKPIEDMMTTVQWGTVFNITDFEVVTLGKDTQNKGIVE